MNRLGRRQAGTAIVFFLLAAACNGGSSSDSSSTTQPGSTSSAATTSTTRVVVTTSTAVTTTTAAATPTTVVTSDLPRADEGDRGDLVEALQFLLNCTGFADFDVDGAFGPATRGAVEDAQEGLGLSADGVAGNNTFLALLKECDQEQRLGGDGETTTVGYADPGDPEIYVIALIEGSEVSVDLPDIAGLALSLHGADGTALAGPATTFIIDETQDYSLVVAAAEGPVGFEVTVDVTAGERAKGDWILDTNSITYKGTEISIGDDAGTVIDQVFEFLGHGIRGAYDEFDTDWYVITEPQPVALRGVFIEGLAFLFFGPDETDPTRPTTLERIRFEGPSDDANGDPRPDNYVTTDAGITVGDTLAELQAAYGDRVRGGSNDDEHYLRLTNTGGELCFYFGAEEPETLSTITEMSTECRS